MQTSTPHTQPCPAPAAYASTDCSLRTAPVHIHSAPVHASPTSPCQAVNNCQHYPTINIHRNLPAPDRGILRWTGQGRLEQNLRSRMRHWQPRTADDTRSIQAAHTPMRVHSCKRLHTESYTVGSRPFPSHSDMHHTQPTAAAPSRTDAEGRPTSHSPHNTASAADVAAAAAHTPAPDTACTQSRPCSSRASGALQRGRLCRGTGCAATAGRTRSTSWGVHRRG